MTVWVHDGDSVTFRRTQDLLNRELKDKEMVDMTDPEVRAETVSYSDNVKVDTVDGAKVFTVQLNERGLAVLIYSTLVPKLKNDRSVYGDPFIQRFLSDIGSENVPGYILGSDGLLSIHEPTNFGKDTRWTAYLHDDLVDLTR